MAKAAKKRKSSPVAEEAAKQYNVEKILTWEVRPREEDGRISWQLEYFVKWDGFTKEHNSWEPPDMFLGAPIADKEAKLRMQADPTLKWPASEYDAEVAEKNNEEKRKRAEKKAAKKLAQPKTRQAAAKGKAVAQSPAASSHSRAASQGRATRNSAASTAIDRSVLDQLALDNSTLRNLVPDTPPRRNSQGDLISSSENGESQTSLGKNKKLKKGAKLSPIVAAKPDLKPKGNAMQVDPEEEEGFAEDEDDEPVPVPPPKELKPALWAQHVPVVAASIEENRFAEDEESDEGFAEDWDDGAPQATKQEAKSASPVVFAEDEDDDEPTFAEDMDSSPQGGGGGEDYGFAEDEDDAMEDAAPAPAPQPAPVRVPLQPVAAAAPPAPASPSGSAQGFAEDSDDGHDLPPPPPPAPVAKRPPPPPPSRPTSRAAQPESSDEDEEEQVQARPRTKRATKPKQQSATARRSSASHSTTSRSESPAIKGEGVKQAIASGSKLNLAGYRIPKRSEVPDPPPAPTPKPVAAPVVRPPTTTTADPRNRSRPEAIPLPSPLHIPPPPHVQAAPSPVVAPDPAAAAAAVPPPVRPPSPAPTTDPRLSKTSANLAALKLEALPKPAPVADPFNHGWKKEQQTTRGGFVELNPEQLASELRKLGGNNHPWSKGGVPGTLAVQVAAHFKTNDVMLSPKFDVRTKGKTSVVLAPKKDLTLSQLAALKGVTNTSGAGGGSGATWKEAAGEIKVGEIKADYVAVQALIEAAGSRQADSLRSDVEVVYVHLSELSQIGRPGGTLVDLEACRAASLTERHFYVFSGKMQVFRSFWMVHAAVTISPDALRADRTGAEAFFGKAAESRKLWLGRRDIFAWAPAAFLIKDGPFFIPPLAHAGRAAFNSPNNQNLKPTLAFHTLIFSNLLALVDPGTEGTAPATATPLSALDIFSFPRPADTLRYDEPTFRALELVATPAMKETSVQSLQRRAVHWRQRYIQMRRWIIIVTSEERSTSPSVPGVELMTVEEATMALEL
ncbi:hypothetical protein RQP46_005908 [Phenoliferia psychrophenolica]